MEQHNTTTPLTPHEKNTDYGSDNARNTTFLRANQSEFWYI